MDNAMDNDAGTNRNFKVHQLIYTCYNCLHFLLCDAPFCFNILLDPFICFVVSSGNCLWCCFLRTRLTQTIKFSTRLFFLFILFFVKKLLSTKNILLFIPSVQAHTTTSNRFPGQTVGQLPSL